jgi:hypothetical protein
MIDGKKHWIAACDFHPLYSKMDQIAACDKAKKIITPELEFFGLRMENNSGKAWVHLDTRPVPQGASRIFSPM